MGTSWLNTVIREFQETDPQELVMPPYRMVEGDHVVGEMDEELQRLYTLLNDAAARLQETNQRLGIPKAGSLDGINTQLTPAQLQEVTSLLAKTRALQQLFWISLRDTFNLWETKHLFVGVRLGFKVVWSETDTQSSKSIFGLITPLK